MRRWVCWLVFAVAVGSAASPRVLGQANLLQEQGKVKLLVNSAVAQGAVEVGVAEVLILTVAIQGASSWEVQPPQALTRTAGWREWRRSSPQASTHILELAPLAPGDYALQLEPWKIREPGGSWQALSWKPLTVRVLARLKDADPKSLRDITAIETIPEDLPGAPWPWLWIGLSAGLVGAVIVTGGCLVLVRRGASVRSATAAEDGALQRLERLVRLPPGGAEWMVRAHGLLAKVMRGYLARRWRVPALRRTTRELAEDLPKLALVSEEDKAWIQQLLELCDQVRFARRPVTHEEWQVLVDRTRRFFHRGNTKTDQEKQDSA